MIPIVVLIIIVAYVISSRLGNTIRIQSEVAEKYHTAQIRLFEYICTWDESPRSNLTYIVPTSLESLDDEYAQLKHDVQFQVLLKEKHEAYIAYLEVHTFVSINQAELILLLDEFKDDDGLYNRTMDLILR